MQTRRGSAAQSSMEYLLLLTGAIMVAAIILTLLIQSSYSGKSILEENLNTSQVALTTATENAQTPLTTISFSVIGGDGNVSISYSAPGAGQFILVEEKGSDAIVKNLILPEDFETIPTNDPTIGVFGLLFFEHVAESGGTVNCVPYYYRLRACTNDKQSCLVSDVQMATPHPQGGCS